MSILKRSTISVISNAIKGVMIFLTGIFLAKGLGSNEWGQFAFLLASFMALTSILDMGTSNAFFAFISKQSRGKKFFRYYFSWIAIQFLIAVLFITILAPDNWIVEIWQGESRKRVIFAFVAVFLQQRVWNMIAQIGEAHRLTLRVQLLAVAVASIHIVLICAFYMSNALSIDLVFGLIILESLVIVCVSIFVLPVNYSSNEECFSTIFREYWIYCKPLIPFAWLGVISAFADTWLLENFGGSIQQGYFGNASRFAAITLIATTSILRILWKEVSEANERGEQELVRKLYKYSSLALFLLGASISGFLIPWTDEIIVLTLGDVYSAGAIAMSLMFLYPIHQSLGQINGSMYYSLGMTRTYVKIGIVTMSVSLLITYFLLAPKDALIPGLNLASTGLAIKMVVVQVFSVNILIWTLAKKKNWSYDWTYQLLGIAVCLVLGFGARELTLLITRNSWPLLIQIAISGIMYMFIIFIVIYFKPQLFGVTRIDRDYVANQLSVLISKTIGLKHE